MIIRFGDSLINIMNVNAVNLSSLKLHDQKRKFYVTFYFQGDSLPMNFMFLEESDAKSLIDVIVKFCASADKFLDLNQHFYGEPCDRHC